MVSRSDKKAQTRAKLLEAARRVFAAKGYHGAAVDDVAIEAGLTKGAVYAHFRTKEALFLALLRERGLANLADVEASLDETVAAPDARNERFLDRFMNDVKQREWTALTLEFILHASRDPSLRRELHTFQDRGREIDAELIERAWAEIGVDPAIDPEDFDRILSGLALHLAIEQLLDPRVNLTDVAKRTYSFLFRAAATATRR